MRQLQAHLIDFMDGYFLVNAEKMHDQSNHYRNEKAISDRLSSRIKRAQGYVQPEKKHSYRSLIKKVEQLSTFYQKAANALDETADMISYEADKANRNFEELLVSYQGNSFFDD